MECMCHLYAVIDNKALCSLTTDSQDISDVYVGRV